MKPGIPTKAPLGMSLVEMLVTISIIAILSVLAIPTYMNYYSSSQAAFAGSLLETLNTAVHRFNEGNYELVVDPGTDSAATVELSILHDLQYRNPLNPKVGSPYIHKRWNPLASSDTSEFRLKWMGRLFVVLAPGTPGTGMKVDFKASDMGTPYSYPADYDIYYHNKNHK